MVAFRLDLREGDIVDGKYRIVKSIGRGSYGDVFLVQDSYSHYAMKVLRLYDEPSDIHNNLIRYFKQEYETAKIPGECFVHSLDYSEVKGNPYFTMEYCSNGDLAKYIGRNTRLLPLLAKDILIGLHDLHTQGKIHRDLKPENVLIRENGRAALTDFGVVGNKDPKKRLSSKNIFHRPKQKFGSPLYMAPEMNEMKGGGVTYLPTIDIWSFGVMMYELLTFGKFPFGEPKDLSDLPQYHVNGKKGKWSRQVLREACYGRDWLPIIGRCLMPNYQERYQNVYEIIKDLNPLIGSTPKHSFEVSGRSVLIKQLIITQGEEMGKVYVLNDVIEGKGRMIRVGRNTQNDIVLRVNEETYLSRHHFTLERSYEGNYWIIKDGQWMKELRQWENSTNGTYLNSTPVSSNGQKLFTGDIITVGEYKLKVE